MWKRIISDENKKIRYHLSFLTLTVIFGIIMLQELGMFEAIEYASYDQFLRWHQVNNVNNERIVIVGVTEQDIHSREWGGWPISDKNLAILLKKIIAYKPRVIGLDIFRDLPVPLSGEELPYLEEVLETNPSIVVTEKVGKYYHDTIAPPQVLQSHPERIGFNDFPVDSDGVVRRALLFLDDGKKLYTSLALQISLLYLAKSDITVVPDADNPDFIKLGDVTLPPLERHDGGYRKMDARGYQFLLDFLGPLSVTTFSAGDFFSGKIKKEALEDRIVLIGVTAESIQDNHRIPLMDNYRGILLHAMSIEQLLRHGLQGVQPTKFLQEWQELCWLIFWSLLGVFLSYFCIKPMYVFLMLAIGIAVSLTVSWIVFTMGWWIPISPAGFGWSISFLFSFLFWGYTRLQDTSLALHVSQEKLEQYNRSLEKKVKKRTQTLNEKNQALELTLEKLKRAQDQLVTQEKLAFLGTLTAGIAHEIRNPLNFITNFSQISISLAKELVEIIQHQRQREDIEEIAANIALNTTKIHEHGQRANTILTSMLDHARQEGNNRKESTNIGELIEQTILLVSHGSRTSQVEIKRNYNPGDHMILVYRQELGRVFLNILKNAWYSVQQKKHGFPSYTPQIRIAISSCQEKLTVIIRDNGEGVPVKNLADIFTPFFTLKPPGLGSGLGLSISYDIIHNLHGGTLRCTSEPGEYAEFIIALPKS